MDLEQILPNFWYKSWGCCVVQTVICKQWKSMYIVIAYLQALGSYQNYQLEVRGNWLQIFMNEKSSIWYGHLELLISRIGISSAWIEFLDSFLIQICPWFLHTPSLKSNGFEISWCLLTVSCSCSSKFPIKGSSCSVLGHNGPWWPPILSCTLPEIKDTILDIS